MTNATVEIEDDRKFRSLWSDVWSQFRTHRGAMIGSFVFIGILLAVSIGPYLWTLDPNYADVRNRNQGMSWGHPFGTDQLGHDMLAQVLQGGRISIAVGLTAMMLSLVLGTFVGVLAGYFKTLGWHTHAGHRPISGLADFAAAAGYHHAFPRYATRNVWSRNRYFHPDRVYHRHDQLDANCADCARRCVGPKRARVLSLPPIPLERPQGGSSHGILCPTSFPRSWCRQRSALPRPSSPKARFRSSALASRQISRLGAACCLMAPSAFPKRLAA